MGALSIAGSAYAVPSVQGTLAPLGLIGDANGDGVANAVDQAIVQANLGKAGNLSRGDFDGNGFVTSADLTLVTNNLNRRMPSIYVGKLVDQSVAIPSAAGNFQLFDAPVVDKTGNMAFLGAGTTINGVYKWTNGALTRIADSTMAIPSGSGAFDNFSGATIAAGRVMFQGVNATNYGIYASTNGVLSPVVTRTTPRPEGGTFATINDPTLTPSAMSFVGAIGSTLGAYEVTTAGNVVTVKPMVNDSTPIPGGVGNFTAIENTISDGPNFYFVSNAGAQYGIYRKTGDAITPLIDRNTVVPGTSMKFTRVGSVSEDAGNLSFFGKFGGASGVYSLAGSKFSKVADTSTPIPGGQGNFAGFGASSAGGASVAFVGYDASTDPNYGIYAWVDGQLTTVIDSSVTIGGKIIRSLELSRRAVVGNRVVFGAVFTDNTTGIFSASLLAGRVSGDVNNDGAVNAADSAIVRQNLGSVGVGYPRGDINADGTVDFADLQLIESSFGRTGVAPLLGDLDGNGLVDRYDLKTLTASLGKYGSLAQGDFDGDGKIGFGDLQFIETNFGKSTANVFAPFGPVAAGADVPALSAVPEPTTLAALTLAAATALTRRRRA